MVPNIMRHMHALTDRYDWPPRLTGITWLGNNSGTQPNNTGWMDMHYCSNKSLMIAASIVAWVTKVGSAATKTK